MRKISTLGLSLAILAATGWLAQASAQAAPDASAPAPSSDSSTPAPADSGAAPAAPAKTTHKHHMSSKGIHRGTTKGDAAVEDLNAQSLSAAKAGTAFKPATTPTPDKAPAKSMKGMKGMHHHKKAAAPAAPAADAPAPDSSK